MFDELDETEFEDFCCHLLGELGFVNIDWRKGTGLSTSPSDRWRDIVCQLEREDIDGTRHLETWFVEYKHYTKGVPPEKLRVFSHGRTPNGPTLRWSSPRTFSRTPPMTTSRATRRTIGRHLGSNTGSSTILPRLLPGEMQLLCGPSCQPP